jgi:hypothetical protein
LHALARQGREGAIEVLAGGYLERVEFESKRAGGLLRSLVVEEGTPDVGIPDERDARESRDRLPQ